MMNQFHFQFVAELDALPAEVDVLKRPQAESGQCPQPTLDALLPALLARAWTHSPPTRSGWPCAPGRWVCGA
jgi:hypothetical protein